MPNSEAFIFSFSFISRLPRPYRDVAPIAVQLNRTVNVVLEFDNVKLYFYNSPAPARRPAILLISTGRTWCGCLYRDNICCRKCIILIPTHGEEGLVTLLHF